MKRIVFSFLLLLFYHFAIAQNDKMFSEALLNFNYNQPFSELKMQMEQYYSTHSREKGTGYKQWKRYEWWQSLHLTPDGKVGSIGERNKIALNDLNAQSTMLRSTGNWSPIGSTWNQGTHSGLGRPNCIAFNPQNSNQVYVGFPNGGVWMGNINAAGNAAAWTPLTDDWLTSGVSSIVVQQNNPNIIYALTGDGNRHDAFSIGLLKSRNGGYNWEETGLKWTRTDEQFGYKVIQNPLRPNTLFVITNKDIYYSYDAGATWDNIGMTTDGYYDIEYLPGDTTRMVVSGNNYVGSSVNGGRNWTNSSAFLPTNSDRIQLAVSPNLLGSVWAYVGRRDSMLVSGTMTSSYKGIYFSSNSGASFSSTPLHNRPNISGYNYDGSDREKGQHLIDMDIAINPFNANIVLAGTHNIWKSENSGVSFGTNSATHWRGDAGLPYLHEDINFITYNPNDGVVYCGSDGGVNRSTDNGTTWTDISNGLVISQFYRINVSPLDANIIVNGAQDAGGNVRVGATTEFKEFVGGDGMSCMIDYGNASIIYGSYASDVYRSNNGGTTITNIRPIVNNVKVGGSWVTALSMNYQNPQIIYYGASNPDDIFRSEDRGATWTNIGGSGQIDIISCPTNTARVYSLTGNTILRSDNTNTTTGPVTWTNISTVATFPFLSGANITRLAVSPANSNFIWFTVGGYFNNLKVFYSGDAGLTWFNWSGNLPNVAVLSIVVDNTVAGAAYVGTDIGVYYIDNNLGNWKPFRNNLPVVPVNDLRINKNGNKLRAATYGRGIWESDLYTDCVNTETLSGYQGGYMVNEASNLIQSTEILQTGLGTNVFYKAGNKIILNNGFRAVGGSKFKAFIAPCGSGIP